MNLFNILFVQQLYCIIFDYQEYKIIKRNKSMNQSGEVSDSTHQHSSIITKRIKGALRCPKSEALYQQVIQHNFEVIRQLLGKLDTIILRNEQFQFQRVTYGKRICKIQADIQAIHNQYRRQNLFISSKIQQLKLELNSIEKHQKNFLEEVNRKGFKSCKIIDVKMEQFEKSQKCLSNCDTVKYSLNLLDERINVMQKENVPNLEQGSEKINKVESIDSSDRKSTKNIISQTSINKISSFKAMTHIDTRFRRKISKVKNHCKRKSQQFKTNQSFSLKLLQSSQKLGIIKQRNEQELATEMVGKQMKRNSNQVSWNTSANQQFEVQYQESQEKDELNKNKQQEPVSQEHMSMVLNWVCNLMQKIKSQESHKNESIIDYLQVEALQSKINELEKNLDGNKTETRDLQKKWVQTNTQFRNNLLNLAEKCSSELFNIKKQIIDLRQYVIQNMAGKQQTRDAFKILENRLKNKMMEMANQNQDNSDGLMISKCLSCNRTLNNGEQQGPKKADTIVQVEPQALKKKFSLFELKKKTKQMIGKMREKQGEKEIRQKQRVVHKTLNASR